MSNVLSGRVEVVSGPLEGCTGVVLEGVGKLTGDYPYQAVLMERDPQGRTDDRVIERFDPTILRRIADPDPQPGGQDAAGLDQMRAVAASAAVAEG